MPEKTNLESDPGRFCFARAGNWLWSADNLSLVSLSLRNGTFQPKRVMQSACGADKPERRVFIVVF